MNTLILTLVFAVPPSVPIPPSVPDPPPVPVVAEIDPYAVLYSRIQAGEKLVVYSGVRMPRGTVGAVEVQIPGEPAGIYWAYTRPDGRLMIEPLANPVPVVASPPRPFGWRSVDSMTPAEPIGAISAAPSPRLSPAPVRSGVRTGTIAPVGSPTVYRAITGSGTSGCST